MLAEGNAGWLNTHLQEHLQERNCIMNLSTFIVGLIVFLVFTAIVVREVKNRRSGKGGCSCGCENCGGSSICHPGKTADR